jgi:hypothetical protein
MRIARESNVLIQAALGQVRGGGRGGSGGGRRGRARQKTGACHPSVLLTHLPLAMTQAGSLPRMYLSGPQHEGFFMGRASLVGDQRGGGDADFSSFLLASSRR